MSFRLADMKYEGVNLIQVEGLFGAQAEKAAVDGFRALFDRRVGENVRYFVIDISKVSYIDSSGLRELVGVRSRLSLRVSKYGFVLPSAGPARDVLELSGMLEILTEYEYATLDEAFSALLGKSVDSVEILAKCEERLSIDQDERVLDYAELLSNSRSQNISGVSAMQNQNKAISSTPSEKVQGNQYDLVKLHQLVDRYFDQEELKMLCFKLRLDFDSIQGEGKSNKARELIMYCNRHGHMDGFIAKASELRPHVAWSTLD